MRLMRAQDNYEVLVAFFFQFPLSLLSMAAANPLIVLNSTPSRSNPNRFINFVSDFKTSNNTLPFRRRFLLNPLCLASFNPPADLLHVEHEKSGVSWKEKPGESEELKSWMHSNGFPPCNILIKERTLLLHSNIHDPVRYVAANRDLKAGDTAFSVPDSLVVTLERILGNEADLLATNKLSELACLALYLMYEKKLGKNSFWYAYIRELDRQRGRGQHAVESPLLWSEPELDYLTGSPTKIEVFERAERVKKEYEELDTAWFMARSLFQQYPYEMPTTTFSFEIFKQAFAAVQSCVVHLQEVELARRFALVPLGPPLLTYSSNCKAMLTAVNGSIELVVDRPYNEGDPIYIWCGPQPNSKLLINYGFVDDDNPHDRIMIQAALNTQDPRYHEKRIIAQRKWKLPSHIFHVYAGKEKDAILDMILYMRLGYASETSQINSVMSSSNPLSPEVEVHILEQIIVYFKARLGGYPTTLSEDEISIERGKLSPKKNVATRLVRLEKKIISGCLEAAFDLMIKQPSPPSFVHPHPPLLL